MPREQREGLFSYPSVLAECLVHYMYTTYVNMGTSECVQSLTLKSTVFGYKDHTLTIQLCDLWHTIFLSKIQFPHG